MIPPTYKPKTKFMQLAIAEAKRARLGGALVPPNMRELFAGGSAPDRITYGAFPRAAR